MMKISLGICAIFLSFSFILYAQKPEYSYSNYSTSDGLPSNNVYSITTDNDGFLWMGTDVGVIKFDGRKFKIFSVEDGIPSNDVYQLFCDKQNRIWISSFKSDVVYIKNNEVFSKKNDPVIASLHETNSYPRYYEDSKDNLWIISLPGGLYKFNSKDKIDKITFDFPVTESGNITEFNNKIYVVSFNYTLCYNTITNKSSKIIHPKPMRIDGLRILNNKCYYINAENNISISDTAFLSDGHFVNKSVNWNLPIIDSEFWVTSNSGLKLFNLNNINKPKTILSTFYVSTVHQDQQKNIWVSTIGNGILKLFPKSISIQNASKTYIKEPYFSILVDKNTIYIGNLKGDIIAINKNNSKLNYKFSVDEYGLTKSRILKMIIYKDILYFATDRGIYSHNLINRKTKKILFFQFAFKNIFIENGILLALSNSGFITKNISTNQKEDTIISKKRFYSYIKYNKLNVTGSQDSIYYLDSVIKPYPLNIPFNYRAVDLLVKDSLLIATTAEKGIFFIRDHDIIKNIDASNGFSTNTCYKSVLYKDALFTASKKGINIYDFKTDSIFHIFESDGLPSNTVYDLCIQNDTIYAATENGLSIIPIQSISHFKSFPLFIKPIYLNKDTLWDIPKNLFARTDATVELVLNGLSFDTKSNVNYFYRIKEIDTTYKSTIDQNIAFQFPHIGQYTFEAYSENSEGTKSNKIIFTIQVIPYFYQSWWFKLCIALIIFLLLVTVYKKLIVRAKQKEIKKTETENKIRNLEIAAWRSAINPHFLFNSLNTMQGLFSTSDFEKANTYVAEFSNMLRKTIDQSTRILVQIEVEIGYLKNFLELEKIKRDDNLQYNISLSNQPLEDYYIPSLMVQPIVENALKHGIQDRMDGMIWIQFEMKENRIFCTITDNGKGLGEENKRANQDSKGHLLIENKIRIVEKLIHHKIGFSFGNKYSAQNNIIGAEAIFSFPILTFDYDDTSNYRG